MKHVFLIGCLLFLAGMVSAQNDCDTAVQLLETSGECSTIDFSGASFDSFNTSCPDSSNSHNLWYYFTAEGPEIDLTASHDQGMDVYISIIRFTSGLCDPVKYTLEACGINSISNLDLLTEGSTYFVVLNVQENAGGAVDLCVDNPDITPPPVNDLPCYAQQISPDSTCVAGTTVNAEPDIENFQCSPEFTNEVWYRFELSEGLIFGVEVYLNSINLSGDVRVALVEFVNDDCNQDFFLKQQYCGSPDGFLFDYVNLNAGSTYYVAVATDPQDAGAF